MASRSLSSFRLTHYAELQCECRKLAYVYIASIQSETIGRVFYLGKPKIGFPEKRRKRWKEEMEEMVNLIALSKTFRTSGSPRASSWMSRGLSLPRELAYEKRVASTCTPPPSPRITLYNFVTARSTFRIPLSFHAAGSDVYPPHHLAPTLPTRR